MPVIRTLLAAVVASAAATATLVLAAPAGATAASAAAGPSPTAAACDRAGWADRVQGAPAGFTGGARGGDYLWHDSSGFHLRVTHRGDDRAVYTGVITSPTPMRINLVKLERGDVAKLSANHRSLVFAFVNYGHVDGVDFHTDCAASITISHLNAGRSALSPDRVYLGATKAHPARIPFTVHRDRH